MDKIREAAKQTGITVHIIKNRHRTGVGSSLRQGLAYLLSTEHDIAVIMAGNGKDDPAEIDRVIEPVVQGECDYVQGSRYLPGGKRSRMPLTRIVFNRLYPLIWTILTQRKCTDVTNGFRCYRLDILRDHRINLDQRLARRIQPRVLSPLQGADLGVQGERGAGLKDLLFQRQRRLFQDPATQGLVAHSLTTYAALPGSKRVTPLVFLSETSQEKLRGRDQVEHHHSTEAGSSSLVRRVE